VAFWRRAVAWFAARDIMVQRLVSDTVFGNYYDEGSPASTPIQGIDVREPPGAFNVRDIAVDTAGTVCPTALSTDGRWLT
jgi:hypothetical protein